MDNVVKSAKSLFQNWIKGTRIAPNIRSIVYTAGKKKDIIYTKYLYIITDYTI